MPASKAGQQALVSKAEALRRLKHSCTALMLCAMAVDAPVSRRMRSTIWLWIPQDSLAKPGRLNLTRCPNLRKRGPYRSTEITRQDRFPNALAW
jgi:hypothetical protein